MTLRVAVAISGGGRTLANLLAQSSPDYAVVGVIASRPDCGGVAIAQRHGLPLLIGDFADDLLQQVLQMAHIFRVSPR